MKQNNSASLIPNLHQRSDSKRRSIKRVLLLSTVFTILLFVLLAGTFYNRIYEYNNVVSELTEKSIPILSGANQLYSQVNGLVYITERLIHSQTLAGHRVVEKELEDQLNLIITSINNNQIDNYLKRQLNVILAEISELSNEVKKNVTFDNVFDSQRNDIQMILNELLSAVTKQKDLTVVSQLATFTSRLNNVDTLSEVNTIRARFAELLQVLTLNVYENPEIKNSTIQNLQLLLLGNEGLISNQIRYLRQKSRVGGRSKFVRNIILDFASQAEFLANKQNNRILSKARETSTALTNDFIATSIFILCVIIGLILNSQYLKKRLVTRLLLLENEVNQKLIGGIEEVTVFGDDEISDIAETFNIFSDTLELQKQTLEQLTMLDGLTNISNRRAFDERFETEWQSAIRHEHPLSIIMIDIDSFKPYNDNYGHAQGDTCLRCVADVLQSCISRQTDFLARYGGEEFVVILPNTNIDGATRLAERLRESIYDTKLPHEITEHKVVTISLGVASEKPIKGSQQNRNTLLVASDKALYTAKLNGRNRVEQYQK